ncbi:Serine--tRNA ligase [Halotydeus destructor]|nr:Serine--tRNA ligase [Halotydeus destructor]
MSIFKPLIDLESILNEESISQLKYDIEKRNVLNDKVLPSSSEIDELVTKTIEYIKVKRELEQIEHSLGEEKEKIKQQTVEGKKFDDIDVKKLNELKLQFKTIRGHYWDLEEKVMPTALQLPNGLKANVPLPGDEIIVREKKKQPKKSFKMLDHVKLSYINESVYSSIVGPDSVYYLGQPAKLHIGVLRSFENILRRNNFVDVTGLDFVKSAVVEAARNRTGERDYQSDPFRIDRGYDGHSLSQQLHLVGESSLEGLCSALSRLMPRRKSPLTRLTSTGTQYDVEKKTIRQLNTIQTVSAVNSMHEADKEFQDLLETFWAAYGNLSIPFRIVMCNSAELKSSECSAYKIEVWLPSQQDWLLASRISHFSDYLPRRFAMSGIHLVGSTIVSYRNIISSIIENNQTVEGKIDNPKSLQDFVL